MAQNPVEQDKFDLDTFRAYVAHFSETHAESGLVWRLCMERIHDTLDTMETNLNARRNRA